MSELAFLMQRRSLWVLQHFVVCMGVATLGCGCCDTWLCHYCDMWLCVGVVTLGFVLL